MKNLYKTERTKLANSFLQLAQLVGEYRLKHYNDLSPQMRTRLREYHKALIDYADMFYASSTSIRIHNFQIFIGHLNGAISSLTDLLKRLRRTQRFIDAFGAATRLGAAIISGHPSAIIASMMEFRHRTIRIINLNKR